jgi:geranylgeranyl diphosphate synthase type II
MKHFQEVQQNFDHYLQEELESIPGYYQEMLTYAIDGGKRLRPVICMDICRALAQQNPGFHIEKLALATEWIHTASLIVDDLPCMDDDATRRGRSTIHKRYGEARAQELQLFLIGKSLEYIRHENLPLAQQDRHLIKNLLMCIFKNLGIHGSPEGQLLDIQSDSNWKTVIEKKTGTFFEIAFVLGYLGGGGSKDKIPELQECAQLLGTLYQMVDDYGDQQEDRSKKNCINSFLILGEPTAIMQYNQIETNLICKLQQLSIWTPVLKEIITFLKLRLPIIR